jgi:putative ABC transport system permease protein
MMPSLIPIPFQAKRRLRRALDATGGLMQDVRYGLRLLRRQPGFAAVAILTMALGIGATTMLSSVAYGVLMKPLPWSDADRLVRVTETRDGRSGRVLGTVSNGTFRAWRDERSTIEDLGGWLTQTATLTGAGEPLRVPFNPMTPSLLRILRVRPLIGRLFDEGEGGLNQPGVVILSHSLWRERFGARTDVVGHIVRLNDRPVTIVGVMPRAFATEPHPNRRRPKRQRARAMHRTWDSRRGHCSAQPGQSRCPRCRSCRRSRLTSSLRSSCCSQAPLSS